MAKDKNTTEHVAPENDNLVTLENPIQRGDLLIEQVTLTKPNAGTLRGVSLAAVANSDVDALIKVLPRMTYPPLLESDVVKLELPDMIALAGKVIGFFVAEFGSLDFPADLSVDDLMADIAVIFHWPPSELNPMSLTELALWRAKALQRSATPNGRTDEQ